MTIEDYKTQKTNIEKKYELALRLLNKKFVDENAEFKPGDFIFNVTGIIKVEKIGYEVLLNDAPQIVYHGYRYKKEKGTLVRTKDKKMSALCFNLKLIQI